MNRSPLVFILILNYNGRETLSQCLRSVFQLNYPTLRVVVIDNASTDGSFELMKQKHPEAHFIRNSENVGFARGMNVGIRFALDQRAEYVWLVNPDTILSKDSLRILVELLEHHAEVGMASPCILSPSRRKVWFGGGKIARFRMRTLHTTPRSRITPFETGFLSGCALLVKAPVFRIVGIFDERFFLYYEDADLSLRAKRAGFPIVVHPKSVVLHSEESTKNPEKTYWLVRSGLFFFRKHASSLGASFFWIAFFIRWIWNAFRIFILKDTGKTALSVRDAFRDFWKYGY